MGLPKRRPPPPPPKRRDIGGFRVQGPVCRGVESLESLALGAVYLPIFLSLSLCAARALYFFFFASLYVVLSLSLSRSLYVSLSLSLTAARPSQSSWLQSRLPPPRLHPVQGLEFRVWGSGFRGLG